MKLNPMRIKHQTRRYVVAFDIQPHRILAVLGCCDSQHFSLIETKHIECNLQKKQIDNSTEVIKKLQQIKRIFQQKIPSFTPFRDLPCIFSVLNEAVFKRELTIEHLAKLTEEQKLQLINRQLAPQTPIPIEQLYLDYIVLNNKENSVQVYATKKDIVDRHYRILSAGKFSPEVASTINNANAILLRRLCQSQKHALFIHISMHMISFLLIEDTREISSKTIDSTLLSTHNQQEAIQVINNHLQTFLSTALPIIAPHQLDGLVINTANIETEALIGVIKQIDTQINISEVCWGKVLAHASQFTTEEINLFTNAISLAMLYGVWKNLLCI